MGKDPAFLFYPGDAAEDVSHMNRLERGCYFDLIQAQKKFGPLPLSTIQKVLGKDFDSCWESIKMCLTYEKDMYFISWLQDSIEKRKNYSASRAKNREGSKQAKNKETESTYVEHMENGDGNRIEDLKNKKEPIPKFQSTPPDFTKPDIRGDAVVFPYDTEPMRQLWAAWKESRWKNWDEEVYGMYGEQAELKKLQGLNYQQIEQAIGEAISGGWKNLHVKNGTGQTNNGFNGKPRKESPADVAADFARRHGTPPPSGKV
jgi:hypothetical protein